ncbi:MULTISPECIES: hypothetical protein [Thalassospira]|uniref:hypothetical protein n=1 Tax=Thalassospira TaxID=168934 RepID=UPI0008DCA6A6|nr:MULTISPECIES: hypothetical protein [Thalassospira]MDM7978048.1 hypothetical protein [Thalassospira xiamenensis]OHZ03804.1 hypothetical protein BC440_04765 [Thalassospira sp. MIT1004]
MTNIDTAEEAFEKIYQHFNKYKDSIFTEEDAKLHLINDMLRDVLSWPKGSFQSEKHHKSGYSDYCLGGPAGNLIVVEAKRLDRFNIQVAEKGRMRPLKLSSNALRDAADAIEQVRGYADDEGIALCVVTDGNLWIVFKTHVPGKNYKAAEALVFPSMASVKENFSEFYDLLNSEQVQKRVYSQIFDEIHNKRLILDQRLHSPLPAAENRVKPKSKLAFDLDRVFDVYFGKLKGDDDPELLVECFVETRESRIADFSLEKIATKIIANIAPGDRNIDASLFHLVENAIEIDEGQTVFIVGPTGSGKTTFVERFFRRTLAPTLRNQCVDVRLSCLDSGGDDQRIVPWMTNRLIKLLEEKLFDTGHPSYEQLQGMYFGEYKRQSEGPGAALYKKDPEQFKIQFGEFLEKTVTEDREGYLKRLLSDIVVNRKKLPVLVIDNIDEFPQNIKESVFQLSQALRRHAGHALIIFPITDKTAWSFSKSDIFGIYTSVSFFLPTPSPRDVFSKRIEYLKHKIAASPNPKERASYLSKRGIKVSIDDLNAFANVLEEVFIDDEFSARILGELTNYNIRRTLMLAKRVITSPVFDVDTLVASVISGQPLTTNFNKLLLALLKGDYDYYRQDDPHAVFPVFQVDNKVRQSPLLPLRILAMLDAISNSGRDIEDRHSSVQSILDFFDTLGATEPAVMLVINRLLSSRLIEPFDMSASELSPDQTLAITHAGRAHLNLSTRHNAFFDQMSLTTAITDATFAEQIRITYKNNTPYTQKMPEIRAIFAKYLIDEDKLFSSETPQADRYEHQRILIDKVKALSPNNKPEIEEAENAAFKNYQGLRGVIEHAFGSRNYGFISIQDVSNRILVRSEVIEEGGFSELLIGDEVICDLEQKPRGLIVSKIHEVIPPSDRLQHCRCEIIRTFPERSYGFARASEHTIDIFFHFDALTNFALGDIRDGLIFDAEIVSAPEGRSWTVRKVQQVESKAHAQT